MKKLFLLAFAILCTLNLLGCDRHIDDSPYFSWKEEVRLSDNRVIVVDQKRRKGGLMARESWLSFKLPEFGENEIVWHQSLCPLVLNVYGGKLYVIGYPPTWVESQKYGSPHPLYVAFEWEGKEWRQISFNEIPREIYDTNLLTDGFAPNGTVFLTLGAKDALNNRPGNLDFLRKLDPKARGVDQ